jgi:hypothetical protein
MITIYQEAIVESAKDEAIEKSKIVDHYIGSYINHIISEMKRSGIQAVVTDEPQPPGLCYHADTDQEDEAIQNTRSFWMWYEAAKPRNMERIKKENRMLGVKEFEKLVREEMGCIVTAIIKLEQNDNFISLGTVLEKGESILGRTAGLAGRLAARGQIADAKDIFNLVLGIADPDLDTGFPQLQSFLDQCITQGWPDVAQQESKPEDLNLHDELTLERLNQRVGRMANHVQKLTLRLEETEQIVKELTNDVKDANERLDMLEALVNP